MIIVFKIGESHRLIILSLVWVLKDNAYMYIVGCLKNGRKVWLLILYARNDQFLTHFVKLLHWYKKKSTLFENSNKSLSHFDAYLKT